MNKQIYRLLDANANRAREGLRVLEDIARFIMEDKILTGQLKEERHKITLLLQKIPSGEKNFLKARDSDTDVGSRTYPFSEGEREGIPEIVISNFRRSQEAIRVLEEVTKILRSDLPRKFKAMRFRFYTLEKKFMAINRHV